MFSENLKVAYVTPFLSHSRLFSTTVRIGLLMGVLPLLEWFTNSSKCEEGAGAGIWGNQLRGEMNEMNFILFYSFTHFRNAM